MGKWNPIGSYKLFYLLPGPFGNIDTDNPSVSVIWQLLDPKVARFEKLEWNTWTAITVAVVGLFIQSCRETHYFQVIRPSNWTFKLENIHLTCSVNDFCKEEKRSQIQELSKINHRSWWDLCFSCYFQSISQQSRNSGYTVSAGTRTPFQIFIVLKYLKFECPCIKDYWQNVAWVSKILIKGGSALCFP